MKTKTHSFTITVHFDKECSRTVALREARIALGGVHHYAPASLMPNRLRVRSIASSGISRIKKPANRTKISDIVTGCKNLRPNPEHGPGQYRRVIRYMRDEEGVDFNVMSLDNAISFVLRYMNIA